MLLSDLSLNSRPPLASLLIDSPYNFKMSDHHIIAIRSLKSIHETPSTTSLSCTDNIMLPSSSDESRRNRRRCSRNFFVCPSRFILLALCYTATFTCRRSHAFSSPSTHRTSKLFSKIVTSSSRQSSKIFMISVAERTMESSQPHQSESIRDASPRLSDFQKRMKGLMKRNGNAQKQETDKPSNLRTVHTLLDYKNQLEENSDKIVVVRFFATWCKVRSVNYFATV